MVEPLAVFHDAVAVALVNHAYSPAVHRNEVVLRVIGEGLASRGRRVAVGVVLLAEDLVVSVVAEA